MPVQGSANWAIYGYFNPFPIEFALYLMKKAALATWDIVLSRKTNPTLDRSLLLYSPLSMISRLHHYWSYVYKQDHLPRMLAYTSSTQVRFILRNKEEQKGLVSACDSKNFFGRMILKNLDWNNLCRFDSHGGENVNKVNADIFCPKYYFLAWHFLFVFLCCCCFFYLT